jgi:hypothetical protein
LWSLEAAISARPYATYRALEFEPRIPGASFTLSAAKLPIAFGAAASMLGDGRLSLPLFLDGALAWTILPVLQSAVLLAVLALLRERAQSPKRLLTLFLAGNGPWMAWLLLMAGAPIVMTNPAFVLFPATPSAVLPAMFLGAFVWAGVVRHAFFRSAMGMTRWKASGALLMYCAALWGTVVTFLAFADILHR